MGIQTVSQALSNENGGFSPFGFKNRIINGAMVIDQRNAGASITPTDSQYSVDRWKTRLTQASKYSVQQNSGSVTPPLGFKNYLGVVSSSAYSLLSTDYFLLVQPIEGYNTADLGWGAVGAQTVTLSFWVRSSLTGTFGGSLREGNGGTAAYPFTYTINNANTWEYETITVPGPTTGTWQTTTSTSIDLMLSLGAGTTYSGTAGAWTSSNHFSVTGATSVVGSSGATFYITGVQLEKAPQATAFDYRDYGRELALCQRYFVLTNPSNSLRVGGMWGTTYTSGSGAISGLFPVPMRAAPTFTTGGTYNSFYMSNVTATSAGTFANLIASTTCFSSEISGMSASSVGQPIQYNGQLSITAEL
jgi:hypothetical protein